MQAEFAIIGGTGVYDPALLDHSTRQMIHTSFGAVEVTIGEYKGKRIVFLPRHGYKHSVPPHKINFRANIRALQELGVQQVLATAAVGSLKRELPPGSLVIVDDFIDMTKNRVQTFFEGEEGVIHIDMTDPYCNRLRRQLVEVARENGILVQDGGVYVCTEGPRFETRAEIRTYASWGGDVVGMTSVPEVILAKEARFCYATVGIVTNYCSGISPHALTHQEVIDTMKDRIETVRKLFLLTIENGHHERTCACPHALDELGTL
ncbi:putative 6-oxopurine nucleoside phosphorylase [Collibacillus ludicampi]|uniref:Purine nucleoside phosphorylase n=1 Tax=Collibacillus ludicampi TaxID=2771369 RepID=A0AAV4LK02_9BACL|nr:S-methyl-5'-thioadenosine phosphorylase [Collibacillus ludicampi]GIM48055.1 putative 6-oxopurine nucleoside phosphorylase [Collibacillus ludicampi]